MEQVQRRIHVSEQDLQARRCDLVSALSSLNNPHSNLANKEKEGDETINQ